ncbi:MAG: vWA domain-containing protein, partial [Flavobacteriales bacterium]
MKTWASLRPVLGLLLFLELLLWMAVLAGWFTATALVPSLTLHRMELAPVLMVTALLTLLMLGHLRWRHKVIRSLADAGQIDSVLPGYRMFVPTWKFFLLRMALAFLVIAWLDPKMGSRLQEVESEGVDMMVALDVSNSMMTEDVGMARLDLAKRTIKRLAASTSGDRLGLVVFAGEAYVQCPLTTDVDALDLFLESVNPGMVPTQGTAVGRAVEACWQGFDDGSEASRVVVVLTDGENHEDDVVAASRAVNQDGGSLHFIGVATLDGAPIPAFDSRGRPSGFRTDASGQPVVSRLDEATLLEAAQAGGGTYTRASSGFVELSPILQFKDDLEQARISSVSYVDYEHLLMPWLIAAVLLLLLEMVIPKRPKRRSRAALTALALALLGPQAVLAQSDTKAKMVEGTEAFRANQFEDAATRFGEAAMDEQAAATALYNQGCALLSSGDAESASAAFERALTQTEDATFRAQAHY